MSSSSTKPSKPGVNALSFTSRNTLRKKLQPRSPSEKLREIRQNAESAGNSPLRVSGLGDSSGLFDEHSVEEEPAVGSGVNAAVGIRTLNTFNPNFKGLDTSTTEVGTTTQGLKTSNTMVNEREPPSARHGMPGTEAISHLTQPSQSSLGQNKPVDGSQYGQDDSSSLRRVTPSFRKPGAFAKAIQDAQNIPPSTTQDTKLPFGYPSPPNAQLGATATSEASMVPPKAPVFGQQSIPSSPLAQKMNSHTPPGNSLPFKQPPPVFNRPSGQTNLYQPSNPLMNADSRAPQGYGANVSKPSNMSGSDVIEIPRPTNFPPQKPTYPAPQPLFISKPKTNFQPINIHRPIPQAVIDLTRSDVAGFDPDAGIRDVKFGEPDPLAYVSLEQANENIKALLEGAFDDEEKLKLPRRSRAQKKTSEAGLQSLSDRLKTLDVKEEEPKKAEDDEDEDESKVEGLKVRLLPHQVEGVAWMHNQETGEKKRKKVRGGILADDMGLGKTIQSVALILTNPLPSKEELEKERERDKKNANAIPMNCTKSTLVVAPLALIKQWESEINTKVEASHKLKVLVHHGPSRTKSSLELKKYDIVITTYQTLTSEHASSSSDDGGIKVGCMGVGWYRVILDEAHSIKNRNAKSTLACYSLNSHYRWCLTGTPLQNNLDELQSLIRFLRIAPYDNLSMWKEHITRPLKNGRGNLAMRRLQHVLKAFMKRRTKDVLKQDGALTTGGKTKEGVENTSFQIVDRKVETVYCDFSESEKRFYNRLSDRVRQQLNEMAEEEKTDYIGALVMLLRLRQACNHPELIKATMNKDKDALTTGSNTASGTQTPRKNNAGGNMDDLADLLGNLSVKAKSCDVCQAKLTRQEIDAGLIRCNDCEADISAQEALDQVKSKKKDKTKQKIKRNRRIVTDSDDEGEGEWIVSKSKQRKPRRSVAGDSNDENAEGGGEWLHSDDLQTDSESEEQSRATKMKKHAISLDNSEGDETSEDDEESSTSEDESDEAMPSSYKPRMRSSTKIKKLLKILKTETPDHKVIVFSQFTTMLDLIEPFLRQHNHRFVRYDGSMRNDAREASLAALRTNPRVRVLLCSLKCGSLGLNLTAASRVVIVEPFWNPFVEEQAIDRVHRINQTRDVVVYKLTIADSVEERILELQEAKRKLAQAAIEGGKAKKGMGLSKEDIFNLFRREAEYAEPVDVGDGLGERLRVVEAKKTPVKRADHPVYGRR